MSGKVNPNKPVVRKDLDEAVYAILTGMDNMFKDADNPMNKRLDKVESDIGEIKNDIRYIKDDINGIKADLSTTVSLGKFNELKAKVDKSLSKN